MSPRRKNSKAPRPCYVVVEKDTYAFIMRVSKQTKRSPADVVSMAMFTLAAYLVPRQPKPKRQRTIRPMHIPATPVGSLVHKLLEKQKGKRNKNERKPEN